VADRNFDLPDRKKSILSRIGSDSSRRSFLKTAGTTVGVGALFTGSAAAAETRELVILSTDDPAETGNLNVNYSFTATEEIVPVTDTGSNASESNDSVTQNDDGTWTATGKTGNGFGDTYQFTGRILEFVGDRPFELRLDGSPVTVDELTSHDGVQFSVASLTTDFTTYTIDVDAESAPTPVTTDSNVDSRLLAESDDTVTELDSGLYRIEGKTGTASGSPPAYGDTFRWTTTDDDTWGIQNFSFSNADASDLRLTVNGSSISVDELITTTDVEFSIASLTTDFTTYTVDVDAESAPTPVTTDSNVDSRLLAESDDTVTELDSGLYRIEGKTGTASGSPPAYGDTFRWTTTADTWGIEDFQYSNAEPADLTIRVNDSAVSPSDLPTSANGSGSTESSDTSPVVGGGEGYPNTVAQSEASTVVSSKTELVDALETASNGDVVYVPGGTTIDAGKGDFSVPAGVTLASDRGIDGAPGATIQFTTRLWPQFTIASNARVTGLQIYGLDMEYHGATDPRNVGMETAGDGIEIDNCEIAGFRGAAVSASADTHVHHCNIHDNPMDGLGYGVRCTGGHPVVEYCRFNRNRHSVMSSGSAGYTARCNFIGETSWGIPIDIHSPGNGTYEIYNNTVCAQTWPSNHASRHYDGDELQSAIQIRGEPDGARITDNWFYNPEPPVEPADGYGSEAIVKADPENWGTVRFDDNHYGETEPDSSVGCPR